MKSLSLLSVLVSDREKAYEKEMEMGVELVPSICRVCTAGCSILAEVRNDEVVRVHGNPFAKYHNKGRICPRGNSGPLMLNNPDRLRRPLRRVGGKRGDWNFEEITYEEAIKEVAERIKELRERGEPHKLVIVLGQAVASAHNFDVTKALAPTLGTPNVVHIPLSTCIGSKLVAWGFSGVPGHHAFLVPDYQRTKLFLSFGRNLGGSVAVGQTSKAGAARRRYKLVVMDPRLSEWAAKADEWLPVKPGTDLAILLAMINVIINEGLYDAEYLRKYTNAPMLVKKKSLEPARLKDVKLKNPAKEFEVKDFLVYDEGAERFAFSREAKLPSLTFEGEYEGEEVTTVFNLLKEHVEEYTPEWAEKVSGVEAETIRRLAVEVAITKPFAVETGWSANKYYNHFQLYRAAAVLAALTGNLLRPGGVVLSMGGIAAVLNRAPPPVAPESSDLRRAEAETRLKLDDGSEGTPLLPWGRGYHGLLKLVEREKGWVIMVLGGNPARTFMGKAFQRIAQSPNVDYIINVGLMKDDTVAYSDLFLPECGYLERHNQVTGTPFSLAKTFMAAFPAVEAECKSFHETFLDIMNEIDPKLKVEYAKRLAQAIGCPCAEELAKIAEEYSGKREEFTSKLIMLQAEKMGLNYEELKKKGVVNVTDESWGLEMNAKILENGWLNSATGKVEILPLKLLNLAKKKGLKAEWHPLPTWVRRLWMREMLGNEEFVLITGKEKNMSYSWTQPNPLLSWFLDDAGIWIHPSRALELGVKDGDTVEVCSQHGCVRGRAKVTEGINPIAVFVPPNYGFEVDILFGRHKELRFNELQSPFLIDPVTGSHLMADLIVKVRKVGGEEA